MDEGNSTKMSNVLLAGCVLFVSMLAGGNASAGSVTVREINLKGNGSEVILDTEVAKKSIEVDYVRDIIQFSISNATIYPAKMLHADKSSFSKLFAYQYSPNLVRIRFTVDNAAEQFKNKIKWSLDGKKLNIQFPEGVKTAKADDEKSLLDKITGVVDSKPEAKAVLKVEEKKEEKKEEPKEEAFKSRSGNLTGKAQKQAALGGAKAGPSPMRSLLALALVLGGLGLLLIYVKRRNSIGGQARKVNGSSWFSNLLPQNRKQKPIMEVVATHVLGPKQSIVVMKIRGQQFVLAVTAENIQLITQLDAEESELDLLDDPKVAASIGKMFGVNKEPAIEPVVAAPAVATDASFNSLLKNSTGAGAIIARNAYAAGGTATPVPTKTNIAISARDQIRKRLESLQ
jgi:flagellar biogenesis protein FliO